MENEERTELSTVRIKKITLNNFKSVEHGEIVLCCGKKFIAAGTKPDMLGIYGQNGSGKSAMVEAIRVMQFAMTGRKIPSNTADYISVETKKSDLEFVFDMQWPDGQIADVTYKFTLSLIEKDDDDDDDVTAINKSNLENPYKKEFIKYRVQLSDEILAIKPIAPEKSNKKTIFDSSSSRTPYKYTPCLKNILPEDAWKMLIPELEVKKRIASAEARSAIFTSLKILREKGKTDSIEYKIVFDLNVFSSTYLTVIGTRSYGIVQLGGLPLFVGIGGFSFPIDYTGIAITKNFVSEFKEKIESLNAVISTIIPGLGISTKELGPRLLKNEEAVQLALMCTHTKDDGSTIEIPVHYESDGIKRVISFLLALIRAFDQKSFTLVVDEIDSGIFEFLLGEILQLFEESGRGQLIFTSHNLRPLEVINKDSLYFTTTNPANRYMQMKNVHPTNNLRSMYFREILTNSTQEEEVYAETKRYKIIDAIRHSGDVS